MCLGFTFCLLNSRTRFRDPCPVYLSALNFLLPHALCALAVYVSALYFSVAPRFMRPGYLRFSTLLVDLLAYADSLLACAM
jgi:hypothetical protein